MAHKTKEEIREEIKAILRKLKDGEISEDEACDQVEAASQPENPPPPPKP